MLLQMSVATLQASTWAMCMEPHAWQTDKHSSLPKLTAGQTDTLKHILVPRDIPRVLNWMQEVLCL